MEREVKASGACERHLVVPAIGIVNACPPDADRALGGEWFYRAMFQDI